MWSWKVLDFCLWESVWTLKMQQAVIWWLLMKLNSHRFWFIICIFVFCVHYANSFYLKILLFAFQLQNPDYQNLLSNPAAIQAMMQIHQGMSQLQQIAPNMFNSGWVSLLFFCYIRVSTITEIREIMEKSGTFIILETSWKNQGILGPFKYYVST